MTFIDDIKRDREAGTDGDWRLGSWQDNVFGTGPNGEWISICRVKRDNAPIDESIDVVDARRIARVPQMEAALLAAEECERVLTAMANRVSLYSGGHDDKLVNDAEEALTAFRKALEAGE